MPLKTQFIALLLSLFGQAAFAQWSNVNANGDFGRIRASSFVIGDTVYLGSGDDGNPYTNDFRTYTQASNTWNEITRTFPVQEAMTVFSLQLAIRVIWATDTTTAGTMIFGDIPHQQDG